MSRPRRLKINQYAWVERDDGNETSTGLNNGGSRAAYGKQGSCANRQNDFSVDSGNDCTKMTSTRLVSFKKTNLIP